MARDITITINHPQPPRRGEGLAAAAVVLAAVAAALVERWPW